MRHLLLLVLVCLSFTSSAVVYVRENADSITYSDSPIEGGKPLEELPPVNSTTTATPQQNAAQATTANKSAVIETVEKKPYTLFMIASPKDQETIQNQHLIPVDLKLEPDLQSGDKILLLLDNKPWGTPAETTKLALDNVSRGTHTLSAAIIDSQQRVIKQSNTITIYIHTPNLNSPARTNTSQNQPQTLFQAIRRLIG